MIDNNMWSTTSKGGLMRVEIESPYTGNIERNIIYARRCMRDSLKRGEFPIASHLLYTQPGILDDTIPAERNLGMKAGKEWSQFAQKVVVYLDYGVSDGMQWGIKQAEEASLPIEYRYIGENK